MHDPSPTEVWQPHPRPGWTLFGLAQLVLLVGTALDLVLVKVGWLSAHPAGFALLAGTLALSLVGSSAWTLYRLLKGWLSPGRGAGRLTASLGLLLVACGGLANWLLSVQGAVILPEGVAVPLAERAQLQEYQAGPLADLRELGLILRLEKLELRQPEGGDLHGLSWLKVERMGEPPVVLDLSPGKVLTVGPLRLYQGSFGFSPRIVIEKGGVSIFDRAVPFTTLRQAPGYTTFEAEFSIEAEGLKASGAVDLSGLNQDLKGHPTVKLGISRGEKLLGMGELRPGHFAELADGYRVGLMGMERWSEIDFSRRNYPLPVLVGMILSVAGALLWAGVALWERR